MVTVPLDLTGRGGGTTVQRVLQLQSSQRSARRVQKGVDLLNKSILHVLAAGGLGETARMESIRRLQGGKQRKRGKCTGQVADFSEINLQCKKKDKTSSTLTNKRTRKVGQRPICAKEQHTTSMVSCGSRFLNHCPLPKTSGASGLDVLGPQICRIGSRALRILQPDFLDSPTIPPSVSPTSSWFLRN